MAFQQLTYKLRAWLPLLPLLALLAGSYWLSIQVQPLPEVDRTARHEVDFTVDQLSSTVLDAQGMPRYVLSAQKLWHFPDDDTTHLQLPQFTQFSDSAPPLYVSSKTGELTHKGEQVRLIDEVRLLREGNTTLKAIRLETDLLHIVPARDWIDTPSAITFYNGKDVVTAVGMELDNRARTLSLLSNIKATHDPIQ
ncbi:MAG: LPS export ABC transporter periplasmic protein LptC [Sideroxydans sp.]